MLSKSTKGPFCVLPIAAFGAVLMAGGWIEESLASDKQFYEFMKSVGCSKLPMTACELLDPDNAHAIGSAYLGLLTIKICNTDNPEKALQLSAVGATSPECDANVKYLIDAMRRWNGGATKLPDQARSATPDPAHLSGSRYGGVSVTVDPRGEVSGDLNDSVRTKIIQLNAQ